jgi:hypothetical protein
MSSVIQERYNIYPLGVNATFTAPSGTPVALGGFLCITSGNVTVTKQDGAVVIAAFPVTAGAYAPMPFYIGNEFTFVLAGGASGSLAAY